MQKHVILIAGVHRSGTSLLNRLLNLHGVELPDHSDYKNEFNERGYWESLEIQNINDRILRYGDSSWFDVRQFSLSRQSDEVIQEIENEVSGFCNKLLATDAAVFSIKDPRICRLVPIWRTALQNTDARVSAIFPYRHPLEVAASIKHRDKFDANYCLSIWLRNTLDAELATRDLDRVFCSYSNIMSDWPVQFSRITDKLDLKSLRPYSEVKKQVEEFISAPLKHWSYSDTELTGFAGLESLARRTYALLQRTELGDDDHVRAEFDEIREQFDETRSELDEIQIRAKSAARIEELQTALLDSDTELEQQKLKVSELASVAAKAKRKVDRLRSQNDELSERIDGLHGTLHERQLSEDRLQAEIRKSKAAIADKEVVIDGLSGDINSLRDAYKQESAALTVMTAQFDQKCRDLESLTKSFSWRITLPWRIFAKYFFIDPAASRRAWGQKWSGFKQLFSFGRKKTVELSALIKAEDDARIFVPITTEPPPKTLPVRLIAFYLPQFHPIAENNEWWGEGFTEWTNVVPATPQFAGHYQPRVPGELGYYDLRDPEIQKRQVELAQLYGIGGFCFYFYWFRGKRLLETPLLQYLENTELSLPFCLCWANETWSRTWDGLDNNILIEQRHSKADDIAFIEYVSQYLKDERYVRVDGKPLLIIYRPNLFPNARKSANRWRKWCRANGVGEIFLAYTQSFESVNPSIYGFDAAIEFPPNNTAPDIVTDIVERPAENFSGTIYDWTSIASRSRQYTRPDYPLFRSVNPSWDNTARRGGAAAIFAGATPGAYREWLENAAKDTVQRFSAPSERLTFVNAWNEWAEGAYLEPDERYGYAYLQATRDALQIAADEQLDKTIVLVAHDAHPHGAQYLSLHLAKALSADFGFHVDLVVLGDGMLLGEYERWATVHSLAGVDARGPEAKALAEKLFLLGNRAAICNTTVSGLFLGTLADAGLRCISLVHELRNIIDSYGLHEHAGVIAERAASVLFAAQPVADSFADVAKVSEKKVLIRPQGNYKSNAFRNDASNARSTLRASLGLCDSDRIVLGVGYADHRKGVDLFVDAGLALIETAPDTHFVWVGHWEASMQTLIKKKLAGKKKAAANFHFVGRKDDTDVYFAGADVFVLTSREDPFPTTVQESLDVGVPVIGFRDAGGSETLLERGCGLLVSFEDTAALVDAILEVLGDPEKASELGAKGASIVHGELSFRHYVFDLLELCGLPQRRVSAIVPNYNYARHLVQRLESVFSQTYPLFELIVLDDASTDDSVETIRSSIATTGTACQLIVNEENSGSVFKQWDKGVRLAKGEFVWICEADDYSDPTFLEQTVRSFDFDDVVLSYSQSKQIDDQGRLLNNDYLDYTNDISTEKWKQDYINDGLDELASTLTIKNSIPNVSAVVFRKKALEQTLKRCMNDILRLRIAGDWLVYSDLLRHGRVSFVAKALNNHRRHEESVTHDAQNNETHMAEIIYMHDRISQAVAVDSEAKEKAAGFEKHAFTYLKLGGQDENPRRHPAVLSKLKKLSN